MMPPTEFQTLARVRAAAAIRWLERSIAACDGSGSAVYYSRWYLPMRGWYWPYPETTGYIVATLLRYAEWITSGLHMSDGSHGSENEASRLRDLAIRQADWIVSLQYEDGALPGSHVDRAGKRPPSVFNTGQMLIGLCAACDASQGADARPEQRDPGVYLRSATAAAQWLAIGVDDRAGIWVANAYVSGFSPSYYTHVCWPMLEVWSRTGDESVRRAAVRVLDTIISRQQPNGTIADWGFKPGARAFTHTIGYTLWGLLEAARLLGADGERFKNAALRAAEVLMRKTELRGGLAGAYGSDWTGDAWYACITGNCQMAQVWMRSAELTQDWRYVSTALKALQIAVDSQRLRSIDPNVRGALPGSRPFIGRYLTLRYPNWAAKFFVDALMDADAWIERIARDRG